MIATIGEERDSHRAEGGEADGAMGGAMVVHHVHQTALVHVGDAARASARSHQLVHLLDVDGVGRWSSALQDRVVVAQAHATLGTNGLRSGDGGGGGGHFRAIERLFDFEFKVEFDKIGASVKGLYRSEVRGRINRLVHLFVATLFFFFSLSPSFFLSYSFFLCVTLLEQPLNSSA